MKINLQSIDREHFNVHDKIVNGEVVYLVGPNIKGVEWTQQNKIFRSSVWDHDGNLISAGFPKFTNWGESPAEFPTPENLNGATLVEKIDGSLLIVSKWKGNYILRTRGTVDATQLDNGVELEVFKQKMFPLIDGSEKDTWEFSILFEWVSPTQQIVIKHEQPQWYLVGIVNHSDYSLDEQSELNQWAAQHGLMRPVTYTFSTISDLLDNVEKWVGKEGVCVYSGRGQVIHKVKSSWYLVKHRFKSHATLENTVDLFFQLNMPSYQDFEKEISEKFDYECFDMVRGYASRICDSSKTVKDIIDGINRFVLPLKTLPRKEAAEKILSAYGQGGRSAICFTLLDSKQLSSDQFKKLYWQVLKK